MRTPLRRALWGAVAVALFGGLGLTSCASRAHNTAGGGGLIPVVAALSGTPGPVGSATASASRSPVPSARVSPTHPASRSAKPSATRTPAGHPATTKAPAPAPTNLASRLHTIPSGTSQLIVVHSDGYGTSFATLETFEKVSGVWHTKFGAMSARIGTKGFSDNHVENDPTTPTGVYRIGSTMYGVNANPGVKYSYHQLVANDYWDENPGSPTYNSFVHGTNPGGASEALWQTVPQYNYFAVINYNIPVVAATPARGSGIFLHQMGSGGTAGCVSLGQSDLIRVLDWLTPSASPRIVMAPSQNLGRY